MTAKTVYAARSFCDWATFRRGDTAKCRRYRQIAFIAGSGTSPSKAAGEAARMTGGQKSVLYQRLMQLKAKA
ncbi:hypothetical protein ACFOLL_14710 [Falsochrobactrum ovis]|uniref:hypothetical protein n=1 Tax=Falsochrobactrum ovis TaxID=1293442 RepID=UPI00361BF9BC